jgi:iron complex outermembrane receptor protein
MKTGLSGTAGAQSSVDLSGMIDKSSNRFTFRYSTGTPYEDGESNTFKDLYGYIDNYNYTLAEAAFRGSVSSLDYGLSFSYTDDVSFPYLMMDERVNRVYSGFAEYKNNKLYFNYTDHLMDNALRVSNMLMESAAKNMTIGVKGDFYDLYFRTWDINNFFDNNMMHIDNQMIPGVNTYAAAVNHMISSDKFNFYGRIGLNYTAVTETERMDFYEELYPDAESSRLFPTFGLSAAFNDMMSESWGYGLLAEAVSEAPENEALYIAVTKPMAKPNWSGNPTLSQPLKATLRGSVGTTNINTEIFGSYIWNYIYLTKQPGDMKQFQTYTNINALLAGVNVQGDWKYFDIDATYTWAENKTNSTPLAEIPPLRIMSTLKMPDYHGFSAFLRYTFNSEQTRIDESLNESETPSWNKFDLGVAYSLGRFTLNLELENIANQNYYQHLSYFRNPFSSGAKVYEPGRTVRLRILFNQTVFGG